MKKVCLLVSVFVVIASNFCHGMQHDGLKATFFKALAEGDIETVKACVEVDQTLVDACDNDGVCALVKVAEHKALYDQPFWKDSCDSVTNSLNKTKQLIEKTGNILDLNLEQKKALSIELKEINEPLHKANEQRDGFEKLQENQFALFVWILGVGVNEQSRIECGKVSFSDWDIAYKNWQRLVYVVLTQHTYQPEYLKWVEDLLWEKSSSLERDIAQSVYYHEALQECDDDYKEAYRPLCNDVSPQRLALDVKDFLEYLFAPEEESDEHVVKKQKRTGYSEAQEYLRVAFMGRSFLKEFEELFSDISLDKVSEVFDKATLLRAMKTRSQAFVPLFKKMMLFPGSESTAQLNRTFYEALNDYELWWKKGALELVWLKSTTATEYRLEVMRQRKKWYDVTVNFK